MPETVGNHAAARVLLVQGDVGPVPVEEKVRLGDDVEPQDLADQRVVAAQGSGLRRERPRPFSGAVAEEARRRAEWVPEAYRVGRVDESVLQLTLQLRLADGDKDGRAQKEQSAT